MKENRVFRIIFIYKIQLKNRQVLYGIFLKHWYKVYRCAWILYSNTPFFWCFLFFKNISSPRLEATNGKQCCLPPLFFKISLKDTFFHISLNFHISFISLQNACWIFPNFLNLNVHIIRKCIESRHFYSSPRSLLRTPGRIFWKSVSHNSRKRCRKLWFALSKFNQKIWRWLGSLGCLYLVWFVIFLNVMTLQLCK